MPAIDRSSGRNVHFYDATSPEVALGGLIQSGSITEANFIDMLAILLMTETPIRIQHRNSGRVVSRIDNQLEFGEYDVYCNSQIKVNDESWVQRIVLHNTSWQEDAFTNGIRSRDGRCVVSGQINRGAYRGDWIRYQAAHIFPLEQEHLWIQENFGKWITDMDDINAVSKINSLQNGLLLRVDIHHAFNSYLVSVNPDDNYKVVVFDDEPDGLDGRILDPVCRNPMDPHRASDHLLRWHFRQCVFANVRGVGEPIFEHDFSMGEDMMKEISRERYGKERLEMEVAARLRGFVK